MPADTQQIVDAAEKLGKLITEHASLTRYAEAQKAVGADPEASRLFAEFDRELMALAQQEQAGQEVLPQQKQRLQLLQQSIATNLKVKAFSIAQMELTDLLRKVSQTWQRPVADAQGAPRVPGGQGPQGGAPPSPRLVMPG